MTEVADRPICWVLQMPVRPKPFSINDERRMAHWAQKERARTLWADGAWVAAKTHADLRLYWVPVPCKVKLTIPFERRATRDPHNYTGTVVKAVVDGLVRAGLWPDDTADWVEVEDPTLYVDPNGFPTIILKPKHQESTR